MAGQRFGLLTVDQNFQLMNLADAGAKRTHDRIHGHFFAENA